MSDFEWDKGKEAFNFQKHRVDFYTAARAFKDPDRKIFKDTGHSHFEDRFYCIGKVDGQILTVRYTLRDQKIRIIGAGFWRKGKLYYEKG